jgi:hypothetical protein
MDMETNLTELKEQFGVGDKTNRAKLLKALVKNIGNQVPKPKLVSAVYGKADNDGPFFYVLNSLNNIIESKKLKFQIKRTREDGVTLYGLYPKAARAKKQSAGEPAD